jgi:hypothetical protein
MTNPNLAPNPFILPESVSERVAYVKDFVKTKTDLASALDISHNDYDLSQWIFAEFEAKESLTKQEAFFDFLITEAANHGMYKIVHQAQKPRSDHFPTSHSFYCQNVTKPAQPTTSKPIFPSSLTPAASAIRKGKAKTKMMCIIVTPLSHHESSAPSSSHAPLSSTPNSQVWIDLTSPEPETPTTTSL